MEGGGQQEKFEVQLEIYFGCLQVVFILIGQYWVLLLLLCREKDFFKRQDLIIEVRVV